MPKIGRRERLEVLLESERAKDVLYNKAQLGPGGLGPAKYRELKLSAADNTVGVKTNKAGGGAIPKHPRSARTLTKNVTQYIGDENAMIDIRPLSHPTQMDTPEEAPVANSPGEWKVLRMFEQELNEVDQAARKQMARLKVQEQQQALAQQKAEKESERQMQRRQVEKEAKALKADLARWNAIERQKKEAQKQRDIEVKLERQHQIVENKKAREAERAKIRAQEQLQIANLRLEMDADIEKERSKKEAKLAEMQFDMAGHKELLQAKQEQKLAEKEADRVATLAYANYLEQQDEQREANLKKMYGKALERSQGMEGSAHVLTNKVTVEEKRLQRVLKDKEKEFSKKEELNKQKKASKKEEQLRTLQTQIKEKEAQKAEAEKSKVMLAEMVRERDAQELGKDQENEKLRRARNMQHRTELEAQIADNKYKKETTDEDAMSAPEAKFNALLLERARSVLDV
mmetsp:Transcript_37380/g.45151  ORF Transcript_37380/g.45151 Transcript_37380/m.45151 type:complete len:459 (+) Transcript_37380:174-1550(+)|eukprot:CAMPEP_0197850376 /NCGR_PEP_ID=MMETSP1438-20131217/15240_1 /TAXON_ID=1461541 /ORGANISM="Pterosperma sp., Strain CCMP1384" /LENGTH=458 /DNA_ID=CAMNT_0043463525 /DNA_START=171 /DNA_END=1547 /DNA_ORIENTATION=-